MTSLYGLHFCVSLYLINRPLNFTYLMLISYKEEEEEEEEIKEKRKRKKTSEILEKNLLIVLIHFHVS